MKLFIWFIGGVILVCCGVAFCLNVVLEYLKEKTMRGYVDNKCGFCKKPVGDSVSAVYLHNRWFCCHRHYRFWLQQQDTGERRRESDKRGEDL